MSIEAIKTGMSSAATQITEAGKQAFTWIGRNVQYGVNTYGKPLSQRIVAGGTSLLQYVQGIIKSGPGVPFAVAAVCFAVCVGAFKYSEDKALEGQECAQVAWRALGVTALIAAVGSTSIGIAAVLA